MTSSLFLLALLASLALAQLEKIPQCGLECIISAIGNSTCDATDTPCICANEALQSQSTHCVLASCSVREQLSTLNITNVNCGIVPGHDLSWRPPMVFFIVLAGFIFVLRLVSRLVCHMKFWWDDFLNLLAAVAVVGYSVVWSQTANLGLGTDIWAVPQNKITTLLKLSYVNYILYNWSQITIRTSVLLFYLRIFAVDTAPRRIFWSILIISNVVGVGFLFFNLFQCTPVNHFWLQWDGEHDGHCIGPNKIALSGGFIDLFWALVILVVPVLYVLRLKLPLHKKIAAAVMFAWGILTIAIMCYRFQTLQRYDPKANITMDGIPLTLWSGLELDVALICACMPSVYPLFLRLIHLGRRETSKSEPGPGRSFFTIGGSGGKNLGRIKKRGPWSILDTTRLSATNPHDSTSSKGDFVELSETPTR